MSRLVTVNIRDLITKFGYRLMERSYREPVQFAEIQEGNKRNYNKKKAPNKYRIDLLSERKMEAAKYFDPCKIERNDRYCRENRKDPHDLHRSGQRIGATHLRCVITALIASKIINKHNLKPI